MGLCREQALEVGGGGHLLLPLSVAELSTHAIAHHSHELEQGMSSLGLPPFWGQPAGRLPFICPKAAPAGEGR